VPLRDVQEAASHVDPRTTMRVPRKCNRTSTSLPEAGLVQIRDRQQACRRRDQCANYPSQCSWASPW
jgi:hypothetical protein